MTTTADVLEQVHAAGVRLSATPDGKLNWRCWGPLPEGLRKLLAEHKAGLVALLGAGKQWDKSEADVLIAEVQAARRERFGPPQWPADPGACRELGQAFGEVDRAFLVGDMDALRKAAQGVLTRMSPLPPPAPGWDAVQASRLLQELRAEVQRIEARDFAGRPPQSCRRRSSRSSSSAGTRATSAKSTTG